MSDQTAPSEVSISQTCLVVEDDVDALESLMRSLRAAGILGEIRGSSTVDHAKKLASELSPRVVVMDLSLDDRRGVESGFELLRFLVGSDPTVRVIVLTGHGSLEHGVRALGSGASSFIEKPADLRHLSALVRDQLLQSFYHRQYLASREHKRLDDAAQNVIGESAAISRLRDEILFLSQTPQPVFITGETGVGKSHIARIIHSIGKHSSSPFVTFSPTVGHLDLAMSELFGHKKGSFTGATEDRTGLFAVVGEGTLFFDEVDELPADVQVAILRVIQEKLFRPRGEKKECESKARLIFASNRDPEEAQASGKLRKDLYHRAAHVRIHLPPLRERREDLSYLAQHFVEKVAGREQFSLIGIDEEAVQQLRSYEFPGNIRELEAMVETACYRASYEGARSVRSHHFRMESGSSVPAKSAQDFRSLVDNYQRTLIEEALSRCGGNQVKAAEELKLDRSTLRRIISRLDIQ